MSRNCRRRVSTDCYGRASVGEADVRTADEPKRLSPVDAVGPVSGAQTQLPSSRCGCVYSAFTSPDAQKIVFGVDGKILYR